MDPLQPQNDSDLTGIRVARALSDARRPLVVAGMVMAGAIAVIIALGLWSLAGLPAIPGEGWWQVLAGLAAGLAMPIGAVMFIMRMLKANRLVGAAGAVAARNRPQAAAKSIDPDSTLGRALRQLEEERQPIAAALTQRRKLFSAAGLVIGLIAAWFVITEASPKSGSPLMGAIIVVIAGVAFGYAIAERYAPAQAYGERFKAMILPSLLADHGAFAPVPPPQETRALLLASGLTGAGALQFLALEDCFAGEHKGAKLVFGEMKRLGRSKQGQPEADNPVYAGIFIHAQSRYPLNARLQVMSADTHPETAAPPPGTHRIRLEDPIYEAAFLCHCNDEVEARAVLTPTMMQTMLELADGVHFLPPALYAHERDFLILVPHISAQSDFLALDPTSGNAQAQLAAHATELNRLFTLADTVLDVQRVRLGVRNL